MPFVKEQDLLKLHEDLENANRDNLALLQQLSAKEREVRKMYHQRMAMVGLSLSLLIITLSIMAFAAGMITQTREVTREVLQVSKTTLESKPKKDSSATINRVLSSKNAERVTSVK